MGPLAVGCWRFVARPDRELRAVLETGLGLGMNLVDTADIYGLGWGGQSFGEAEENLGRILAEFWLPQLARQIATIDRMLGGRLTVNIISSDMPGESLESAPRYRRTLEWMHVLRTLLDGQPVDFHGEFVDLSLDPPRARTVS